MIMVINITMDIGYTVAMVGFATVGIVVLSVCWAIHSTVWSRYDDTDTDE